ncbi:MAG: pectinesterase family protein, partial [Flavisolibacter sp.]
MENRSVYTGLFLALNLFFTASCFSQERKLVVDVNGKGDFKSIQQALDSLSDSSASPTVIFVKNGIYHEKVFIQKHNIILKGED